MTEHAIKHKNQYAFLFILGGCFLALLCGVTGFLVWLWGSLEDYELTTPQAALRRYAACMAAGDEDAIYEMSGFVPDAFNDREDYFAYLKSRFSGDWSSATFSKTASGEGDIPCYEVYFGDWCAGALELYPAAEGSTHGYAWEARAVLEYSDPFEIEAPAGAVVLVNGKKLSEEARTQVSIPVASYEGVQPEELIPTVTQYRVGGLLREAQISAIWNGESCAVEKESSGDGERYTVRSYCSGEKEQPARELISAAAHAYAAYITQDAAFGTLQQYLYTDTEFYRAVRNFYNGYYNAHDSYEFRNEQIGELMEYSEDDFTGTISFDYVVKSGARVNVYPSSYQVSFLKIDGQWKLVNLITQ